MKRILTAVITAIEAGAVALAGLVLVAIPGILLWTVTFQLASEPAEAAAGVAGVWLLGFGVPLGFSLDPQAALALGLTPEALKFTLSLAPLGLGLFVAGIGARIGWRLGRRGGDGAVGIPAGGVGFAAITLLSVSVAGPLLAAPVWTAVLIPALYFTVPAAAGFVVRAAHDGHEWWHRSLRAIQRFAAGLGWNRSSDAIALCGVAGRVAAATLAVLVGLASLGVTVSLIGGYVQVVTLSQQLQLDPLGATVIFLLQMAMLPVAVIWALAWFVGSGFAIGTGTSVTPFETLLGPVPSLPMFGAIPPSWGSWGAVAILLVVLGALVTGTLFARGRGPATPAREAVIVVIAAGLVGLAVAGLATLATGSIGPDRLAVTGPDPWLTGGLAAAEVALGLALGAFAARIDVSRNLARLQGAAEVGSQRVRSVVPGLETRARSLQDQGIEETGPALGWDAGEVSEDEFSGKADTEADTAVIDDLEPLREVRTPAYEEYEVGDNGAGASETASHETDVLETLPIEPVEYPIDGYVPGYTDQSAGADAGYEVEAESTGHDATAGLDEIAVPDEIAGLDEIADEDALIRAYAWDDSAFTEPLPDEVPDIDAHEAPAGSQAPWWRQLRGGLWQRSGQRLRDDQRQRGAAAKQDPEEEGPEAADTSLSEAPMTDAPTVDLGKDPLAGRDQLD